jgi:hypothetical protein
MRQDDPSNPFTPRVCGFVLPAPTSRARRRAWAASFSACSTATPLKAITDSLGQEDRKENSSPTGRRNSLWRTVRFHEPSNHRQKPIPGSSSNGNGMVRDCVSYSDREEIDPQQDFDEVTRFADSIDFDNSGLISFEMLTPLGLRGGEMEVRTFRPVRTIPGDDSPLTVKHKTRISQRSSCQVSNLL